MSKILIDYITDLKCNFQEILIFFVLALLLYRFLKYLWQEDDFINKVSKIQGPLALPIIGSAYIFFRNRVDYMKLVEKLHYQYPKICKIWLGPSKVVCLLSDPEYVEKLFTNPLAMEKADFYDMINDVAGPGLLSAPDKIWKPHRRAINPSFSKIILDSYVTTFAEASAEFVNQLREVGHNKNYNWSMFAKRYSLDVACKTIIGVDLNINYSQSKGDDLGHCIEMINHYGTIRVTKIWYYVDILYKFSSVKKEFDKYKKLFKNIVTSAVREKLHQLKENNNADYAETEATKRRPELMELIYKNPIFTENSLIYEVNTFLGAATDTTGTTICMVFLMLAMHPDIQQKVYDEVIDVIGLTGEIEASNLVKMKYTERVIKETLRLFPPGELFGRTLTGDVNLGDVIIPKGAMALLIPIMLHRDPKYWKDPLTFNPDRFLPEKICKQQPCTYVPFSYGPKNCIGTYYAHQIIKTLTATVIREFKMYTSYKSVEEIEYYLGFLLSLIHGFKLWFEPRT